MKLFQTIQKNLSILGISSLHSIEKHPFNAKVLVVYFNFAITMIFYLLNLGEGHMSQEYIEIGYRISITIICTIHLTILVLKMKSLFELFANCQEAVEKSECMKYSSQKSSRWINIYFQNWKIHHQVPLFKCVLKWMSKLKNGAISYISSAWKWFFQLTLCRRVLLAFFSIMHIQTRIRLSYRFQCGE